MKTNVFLCNTDYHVLLSILLASEKFSSEVFCNKIILCNQGRLNNTDRYNLSRCNNIDYQVCEDDFVSSSQFTSAVLGLCTGTLFMFNLNNPHFLYLLYKIKKNELAQTAFVQEGLASYNDESYTIRKRLMYLKMEIPILKRAKVHDFPFLLYCFGHKGLLGKIFSSYRKAVESPFVDQFWLTIPEESKFGTRKLCKLPGFTANSIRVANSFFQYEHTLSIKTNDFVFIDQMIDGSIELVGEIATSYPNTNIYLKPHPKAPQEWVDKYKKYHSIHILSSLRGIPIEIFLLNLKKAIVLSPYSSSLLIDNPLCRYYYLYEWYLLHNYDIGNTSLFTPGKHIRRIKSISEIETY